MRIKANEIQAFVETCGTQGEAAEVLCVSYPKLRQMLTEGASGVYAHTFARVARPIIAQDGKATALRAVLRERFSLLGSVSRGLTTMPGILESRLHRAPLTPLLEAGAKGAIECPGDTIELLEAHLDRLRALRQSSRGRHTRIHHNAFCDALAREAQVCDAIIHACETELRSRL